MCTQDYLSRAFGAPAKGNLILVSQQFPAAPSWQAPTVQGKQHPRQPLLHDLHELCSWHAWIEEPQGSESSSC